MRHRKAGRQLGRNSAHRRAMYRNMATSLLEHGQIQTTDAKAKELRKVVDRLITLSKRVTPSDIEAASGAEETALLQKRLHAVRQVRRVVRDREVLQKIFTEYSERYQDRPGGYTRITKIGRRQGDNAPMSVIELVTEACSPRVKGAQPVTEAAEEAPEAVEAVEAAADEAPAAEEAVEAAEEAPEAEEAVEAAEEAVEAAADEAPAAEAAEEAVEAAAEEAPAADEAAEEAVEAAADEAPAAVEAAADEAPAAEEAQEAAPADEPAVDDEAPEAAEEAAPAEEDSSDDGEGETPEED